VYTQKAPQPAWDPGGVGHPPAPRQGLGAKVHPPVKPPSRHLYPIPKPPVSIKKEGVIANQS